ncbi:unknown [Methanoculleus sp. CAG:1088]|nr:unknown [Methanoculleus sp. CAG:1088]
MAESATLRQHWNSRSCSYNRFVVKGFSDISHFFYDGGVS